MSTLIKIKIDVTKIDKNRIYVGQKGKYLSMDLWLDEDKPDKYDNTIQVSHEQSKEEREAKADRIFLGDGKVWWRKPIAASDKPQTTHELADSRDLDGDIPF